MIRILIADDHPIFRNGLKQIIEDEDELAVIDEAQDGKQVLSLLQKNKYDVLLLDLEMPVIHGLDVLQQAKQAYPELPVLILSFHSEDQYAVRALKLGADGYLAKDTAADDLVSALKQVLSGGKYVSHTFSQRLLEQIDKDPRRRPHEELSNREFQVFRELAQGRSIKEISYNLSLSPKTVSTYKTRIMEKMRMSNEAQLIRYALDEKLI